METHTPTDWTQVYFGQTYFVIGLDFEIQILFSWDQLFKFLAKVSTMFVKILFFKKVLISNPDTVTMSASCVKYSKPYTFQEFVYNDLTNEIGQARKSQPFEGQTEYLQNSLLIFLVENDFMRYKCFIIFSFCNIKSRWYL